MKAKRLSIKKLRAHAKAVQKAYGIKVKWGGNNGCYNEVKRTAFVPFIRTHNDYMTALHEFGHAMTTRLHNVHALLNEMKRVEKKWQTTIAKTGNQVEIDRACKEMNHILDKSGKVLKRIRESRWTLDNEKIAWQFAVKHSLVWNADIKEFIEKCMDSYFTNLCASDAMSIKTIADKFFKFRAKYVKPIFNHV